MTSESAVSLCAGSIASACWASSTWIGPKKPDQTPMQISESQTTQTLLTGRVGSASAVRRPGRRAHRRSGWSAWRIIPEYHSNERFGVRTRVS